MMMKAEKIYSVSELNSTAKHCLEQNYPDINLEGEISQLQTYGSGHTYFTLKDRKSSIRCVLFRLDGLRVRNRLKQSLEDLIGQNVVLTGRLSIYTNSGVYQFIARNLKLGNEGTLYLKFEELKKELALKGYFSPDRKKKVPLFPKRVGIVTSTAGAALHDIIRVFERRNRNVTLVLYPTAVQGQDAARQIAGMIDLANKNKSEDVLLLARGGGSIEDLWAFNEERVADSIFRCEIPVVTGIGHQTDVTIADHVADEWQATPTAASEKISTPSADEILHNLTQAEISLRNLFLGKLNALSQRVDLAQRGLTHPQQRIDNYRNNFKHLSTRIGDLMIHRTQILSNRLNQSQQVLLAHSPQKRFRRYREQLFEYQTILTLHFEKQLEVNHSKMRELKYRLEGVNPTAILERGYSIIRRVDDHSIVRRSDAVNVGDKLSAQLAEGKLILDVDLIDHES